MTNLTINGGNQTLDGIRLYDNVTISNGGVLYITPYNGTGTTGTLILNVTGDVNIDSTSSINGNARGYLGGVYNGAINPGIAGTGPGAGVNGVSGNAQSGAGGGGGAGYGTVGGAGGTAWDHAGGAGGPIYGTTSSSDIQMGSGGGAGGGGSGQVSGTNGGAGGAALTINAGGNITILGTLNFDGGAGGIGGGGVNFGGGGGGGASGGGIKLTGSTINLTNSYIYARGGAGGGTQSWSCSPGSAGGGGRIKIFGETITITGATITAGTVYSEIVATTGSASFTSSPSGARIWIDGVDQNVNTPSTISGLTPLPASHTYKLVSGIYTATGTFTVTTGMTTNVSITIDVTAIDIISSTNTCVGTCQVTITTTWANNGNTNITFRPAITIDTVQQVQAAADVTMAAGSNSNPIEIVTPTLSIGAHNICPLPN